MKRKIGLMALAFALSATLAACTTAESNPAPTASPNTVTKGLDDAARDMGNMARGAVNDVGRMTQNAGSAMRNW